MKMNRRTMLAATGSAAIGLMLPIKIQAAKISKPKHEWFAHEELMKTYRFVRDHGYPPIPVGNGFGTSELVTLDNGKEGYENFYLALMRISNIIHRRTLVGDQPHWIVLSPGLCSQNIFFPHQFASWSSPGDKNGHWIKRHWTKNAKEVAPGIFKVGAICCRWTIYVDCRGGRYLKNDVLLGTGYKTVVRYKRIKPNAEIVPYIGNPTISNYGLIRCQS